MALSGKGKEIMVQDIIDADNGGGVSDMIKEMRLGGDYVGKDLTCVSHGNRSDAEKETFFKEQGFSSTSTGSGVILNGNYQNNFAGASSDTDLDDYNYSDVDGLEYLPEEVWSLLSHFSFVEDHLENAGIPAGIEAVIPWMPKPGQNRGQGFNVSTPSKSSLTQPISSSGLNQTTHSQNPRSLGDTSLSAGFNYMNEDKSVHLKHGSHAENHAESSFVPAPTKLSGGNSGTSSETSSNQYTNAMKWLEQFENFAVVNDYSDHHHRNVPLNTEPQRAWVKKIQKEWKILGSSLPDTVFVRAYESRMDLLRAVIIGPQGTPYHDGLFFFDVMLPSNYPNEPPHVYYHSGGLRLNPNLYNCGKVCLSLLGTWPGRNATETWIPGKSTLLQVLVSIQALVLNAKPYFNEPVFTSGEGYTYHDSACERYNEEALIKSLTTMLYTMRRPPKHFEEFIANHFISHSQDILLACKAYMDGAQVGSISIVRGKAVRGSRKRCSRNLKDNLGRIVNSLIAEFSKLGVENCDRFRVPKTKNEEPSNTLGAGLSNMSKSQHNPSTDKFLFSELGLQTSSHYSMPGPFQHAPEITYPFQPIQTFLPVPRPPVPPFPVGYPLPHVAMNSSPGVWNQYMIDIGNPFGPHQPAMPYHPQTHLAGQHHSYLKPKPPDRRVRHSKGQNSNSGAPR